MDWKKVDELDRTGYILALCQDETGIYNQMMIVAIEKDNKALPKRNFYQNVGLLGESVRVPPYKVVAGIYIDEICTEDTVKQFCTEKKDDKDEKVFTA